MSGRRIIPYFGSADFEATRTFYTEVLDLHEGEFGGEHVGFGDGSAQVVFARAGAEQPQPQMGVEMPTPADVDRVHAEVLERGHEVVYGPVDEAWGVHRFFVRDPDGVVVSVLAHM